MSHGYPRIDPQKICVPAAAIAISATAAAAALLAALHILSPEFSPAWRMVSEYANGGSRPGCPGPPAPRSRCRSALSPESR